MLENNARNFPNKDAIIYKNAVLKYGELNNLANQVANSMAVMGIKKGDIVGLMLPRVPEIIITFMASLKIGAIPAPLNYNITKKDIKALLYSLKPSIIFVDERFTNLLDGVAPTGVKTFFISKKDNNCHVNLGTLLQAPSNNPTIYDICMDDVAYLNHTSGSTGNLKCAVATHSNVYWNTLSAVENFKITEDDVHLCMFASYAHPHELFARALYTGGTIVLLDEIFPKSLVKTIKNNNVTCMMGLAPTYEMLLRVANGKDLSCLRLPESGGMFTSPDLIKRFEKKFGIPIYTVWGSTETTGIAIANRIDRKIKVGSIGKPCPHYDVKIVDESGSDVKHGEVGELIFKGTAVVKGYYNNDDETKRCFNDGWYYSDDLGRMDEEGYLYFVDRKSAMMKVAGLKVYPLEIEQVLSPHPRIKDVAVIKISDGLKGEVPMAFIVPEEGQTLTKEEIRSFCKERLANYKIPRRIEFMDEFPRIGSGKINKKVLMKEHQGKV